jgi:hypothetical protein
MESKFNTDELKPCICGFKPNHYSVWYGPTPYDIVCPNCRKQSARTKCLVTGWVGHLIDYWNKHVAGMTKEELDKEVQDFENEKANALKYGGEYEGFKTYEYYWQEGKGEVLYAR